MSIDRISLIFRSPHLQRSEFKLWQAQIFPISSGFSSFHISIEWNIIWYLQTNVCFYFNMSTKLSKATFKSCKSSLKICVFNPKWNLNWTICDSEILLLKQYFYWTVRLQKNHFIIWFCCSMDVFLLRVVMAPWPCRPRHSLPSHLSDRRNPVPVGSWWPPALWARLTLTASSWRRSFWAACPFESARSSPSSSTCSEKPRQGNLSP